MVAAVRVQDGSTTAAAVHINTRQTDCSRGDSFDGETDSKSLAGKGLSREKAI